MFQPQENHASSAYLIALQNFTGCRVLWQHASSGMTTEVPAGFFLLACVSCTSTSCWVFFCLCLALQTKMCCTCRTICTNQLGGMPITHHFWNLNVGGSPNTSNCSWASLLSTNCVDQDAQQQIPQMRTKCHESRATWQHLPTWLISIFPLNLCGGWECNWNLFYTLQSKQWQIENKKKILRLFVIELEVSSYSF